MIVRLPLGLLESNTYLIYHPTSRRGVIVDPGGEVAPLLDEITARGLTIEAVLNTHGHFDHSAANAALCRHLAIPLGLHPADRELLEQGGGAGWFGLDYEASPFPTLLLEDGVSLDFGGLKIEVIHTPGHTPGSVCLYLPEAAALLTGDTLFAGNVGRTDLPGGSARDLTASLKKLVQLPPATRIYPGHGPESTLAEECRRNPWLRRLCPNPQ